VSGDLRLSNEQRRMATSDKRESVVRFATMVRNADQQALLTAVTPDVVWAIPGAPDPPGVADAITRFRTLHDSGCLSSRTHGTSVASAL
jgi:hypothetical protein